MELDWSRYSIVNVKSVGIKTMDKVYSLIDIRTAEIMRLLKGVDIGHVDFPSIKLEDYDGSAAEIARLVRAKWRSSHRSNSKSHNSIRERNGNCYSL